MLLCRLAANAFWFGRYIERAEDLARALLAYEDIRLDMAGAEAPAWQPLAALVGAAVDDGAMASHAGFVAATILDRANPSALLGALHAARENLRRTRSLFPEDCWHTVNPFYLRLAATDGAVSAPELRELLGQIVAATRELAGRIKAGMLRDEAYVLLQLGSHLERADMTLRIATIVAETLIPAEQRGRFEDVRLMGLLRALGAYETYRHRYQARASFGDTLELLLSEPAFPRSLAYALREIGRDLSGLPRNATALAALKECRSKARAQSRGEFSRFAEQELASLARLGEVLEAIYFFPQPHATTPHAITKPPIACGPTCNPKETPS